MRGEDGSNVSGCSDITELHKGGQQVGVSPGAGSRVEVAVELADKLKPLWILRGIPFLCTYADYQPAPPSFPEQSQQQPPLTEET